MCIPLTSVCTGTIRTPSRSLLRNRELARAGTSRSSSRRSRARRCAGWWRCSSARPRDSIRATRSTHAAAFAEVLHLLATYLLVQVLPITRITKYPHSIQIVKQNNICCYLIYQEKSQAAISMCSSPILHTPYIQKAKRFFELHVLY